MTMIAKNERWIHQALIEAHQLTYQMIIDRVRINYECHDQMLAAW